MDYPHEGCETAPPAAVLGIHGTADPVLAFNGALEAAEAWARHNGCHPQVAAEPVEDGVTRFVYRDCATGGAIELVAIEGGGHRWPGAEPREGDRPGETPAVSANELMWAFFSAHPSR